MATRSITFKVRTVDAAKHATVTLTVDDGQDEEDVQEFIRDYLRHYVAPMVRALYAEVFDEDTACDVE